MRMSRSATRDDKIQKISDSINTLSSSDNFNMVYLLSGAGGDPAPGS